MKLNIKNSSLIFKLILAVLLVYLTFKIQFLQSYISKQTKYLNRIQLNMSNDKDLIEFIQNFIIKSNKNLEFETSFLYAEEIVKVTSRYKSINPLLLTSIIHYESRFDRMAVSRAGAKGMGQIMPEIGYWALDVWHVPYSDSILFDYKTNIKIICWYFEWLTVTPKTTKGELDLVLAWYNGGFKNSYRYSLLNGIITKEEKIEIQKIPKETLDYVYKVKTLYEKLNKEFYGKGNK
jgi:soluble lytic murein transglycosylase-like protein